MCKSVVSLCLALALSPFGSAYAVNYGDDSDGPPGLPGPPGPPGPPGQDGSDGSNATSSSVVFAAAASEGGDSTAEAEGGDSTAQAQSQSNVGDVALNGGDSYANSSNHVVVDNSNSGVSVTVNLGGDTRKRKGRKGRRDPGSVPPSASTPRAPVSSSSGTNSCASWAGPTKAHTFTLQPYANVDSEDDGWFNVRYTIEHTVYDPPAGVTNLPEFFGRPYSAELIDDVEEYCLLDQGIECRVVFHEEMDSLF